MKPQFIEMLLKIISLVFLLQFILSASVASDNSLGFSPCAVEDFQCISTNTANFLHKMASGNSEKNIQPFDPLILDSVKENNILKGVNVEYKNVNVTGLKKQRITLFKVDTVAKTVTFAVSIDLNIESDFYVEYEESEKKHSGTFSANGKTVITGSYDYELKTDDEGVKHFISGPARLTCEFTVLQADHNSELTEELKKDPHASKIYEDLENLQNIKKKYACEIAKDAYQVILKNFQSVQKVLPADALFTNV